MTVTVRPISAPAHLEVIAARGAASFLQTPAWGAVKRDWRPQLLGFFRDRQTTPFGAGLVLYRQVPRLRRYLAYLPEGPVLDWDAMDPTAIGESLTALVAHVKAQHAFGLRIGPPVVTRRWSAATVKDGISAGAATHLPDLPADETTPVGHRVAAALARAGFRPPQDNGGFSAGQPRYVFQVPLAGRSDDELLAGFNQLWRRNIRKAAKAGVVVRQGCADDLGAFHRLYAETAARDGFTPRPLGYFQGMWEAMHAEDPDRLRLYLAHHDGDLVAATTMVQVGTHAWYSYGASSTAKREVRGSNAVQWQMMRDARDAGAT
ncbi:MAG TPA: peptidoglycan bridge formation glycyltransferase FemA/FemB family protein, partial [Actinomycetes bacterium]|nr:peptidoglycan bridge formation glycyltransferase FemA/FemB family protein [Actinomycetes bacterium]